MWVLNVWVRESYRCAFPCVKKPNKLVLTFEALDSMQYGYSPFVVKEACGDRHASVNDSNVRIASFSILRFVAKHIPVPFSKSAQSFLGLYTPGMKFKLARKKC